MRSKQCKYCGKKFVPTREGQVICQTIRCVVGYHKAKKKKKTEKIKRRILPETLKKKADRLLQEVYTVGKCQGCEINKADCVHHYIFKSQSTYLRYKEENLVPICSSCHLRYHKSGDTGIMSRIVTKRGIKWEQKLQQDRGKKCKLTIKYLEEVISELEDIKRAKESKNIE